MHKTPVVLHESPSAALQLLFAGAFAAQPDEPQVLHRHSCWELVYYRTGHVTCPVGDTLYQCQPGMLLVVPPSALHGEAASPTGWSCYFLGIDAPAHLPWSNMCLDDSDGTFGHLCQALLREWMGETAHRDDMIALLLAQVGVLLQRAQYLPLTRGERVVRQVEQVFRERLSASLVIADVAREIGISPSLLRSYFAQVYGQSPLDRLHALRVERALALIRTSDLTLHAIASLCGYDSPSHLSRHVKHATGKSPGSFRETVCAVPHTVTPAPVHGRKQRVTRPGNG